MAVEVDRYTDKILDHNFLLIENFMLDVAETIMKQAETSEAIVRKLKHVSEVAHQAEKASKIVVKIPRRSKLFALTVVGGAFYAGYKLATTSVDSKRLADKAASKIEGALYGKDSATIKPTNTQKD